MHIEIYNVTSLLGTCTLDLDENYRFLHGSRQERRNSMQDGSVARAAAVECKHLNIVDTGDQANRLLHLLLWDRYVGYLNKLYIPVLSDFETLVPLIMVIPGSLRNSTFSLQRRQQRFNCTISLPCVARLSFPQDLRHRHLFRHWRRWRPKQTLTNLGGTCTHNCGHQMLDGGEQH